MNQDQKNESVFSQWERLNKLPLSVYLRFQRFMERKHSGGWWRGITIGRINGVFIVEPNIEL